MRPYYAMLKITSAFEQCHHFCFNFFSCVPITASVRCNLDPPPLVLLGSHPAWGINVFPRVYWLVRVRALLRSDPPTKGPCCCLTNVHYLRINSQSKRSTDLVAVEEELLQISVTRLFCDNHSDPPGYTKD